MTLRQALRYIMIKIVDCSLHVLWFLGDFGFIIAAGIYIILTLGFLLATDLGGGQYVLAAACVIILVFCFWMAGQM